MLNRQLPKQETALEELKPHNTSVSSRYFDDEYLCDYYCYIILAAKHFKLWSIAKKYYQLLFRFIKHNPSLMQLSKFKEVLAADLMKNEQYPSALYAELIEFCRAESVANKVIQLLEKCYEMGKTIGASYSDAVITYNDFYNYYNGWVDHIIKIKRNDKFISHIARIFITLTHEAISFPQIRQKAYKAFVEWNDPAGDATVESKCIRVGELFELEQLDLTNYSSYLFLIENFNLTEKDVPTSTLEFQVMRDKIAQEIFAKKTTNFEFHTHLLTLCLFSQIIRHHPKMISTLSEEIFTTYNKIFENKTSPAYFKDFALEILYDQTEIFYQHSEWKALKNGFSLIIANDLKGEFSSSYKFAPINKLLYTILHDKKESQNINYWDFLKTIALCTKNDEVAYALYFEYLILKRTNKKPLSFQFIRDFFTLIRRDSISQTVLDEYLAQSKKILENQITDIHDIYFEMLLDSATRANAQCKEWITTMRGLMDGLQQIKKLIATHQANVLGFFKQNSSIFDLLKASHELCLQYPFAKECIKQEIVGVVTNLVKSMNAIHYPKQSHACVLQFLTPPDNVKLEDEFPSLYTIIQNKYVELASNDRNTYIDIKTSQMTERQKIIVDYFLMRVDISCQTLANKKWDKFSILSFIDFGFIIDQPRELQELCFEFYYVLVHMVVCMDRSKLTDKQANLRIRFLESLEVINNKENIGNAIIFKPQQNNLTQSIFDPKDEMNVVLLQSYDDDETNLHIDYLKLYDQYYLDKNIHYFQLLALVNISLIFDSIIIDHAHPQLYSTINSKVLSFHRDYSKKLAALSQHLKQSVSSAILLDAIVSLINVFDRVYREFHIDEYVSIFFRDARSILPAEVLEELLDSIAHHTKPSRTTLILASMTLKETKESPQFIKYVRLALQDLKNCEDEFYELFQNWFSDQHGVAVSKDWVTFFEIIHCIMEFKDYLRLIGRLFAKMNNASMLALLLSQWQSFPLVHAKSAFTLMNQHPDISHHPSLHHFLKEMLPKLKQELNNQKREKKISKATRSHAEFKEHSEILKSYHKKWLNLQSKCREIFTSFERMGVTSEVNDLTPVEAEISAQLNNIYVAQTTKKVFELSDMEAKYHEISEKIDAASERLKKKNNLISFQTRLNQIEKEKLTVLDTITEFRKNYQFLRSDPRRQQQNQMLTQFDEQITKLDSSIAICQQDVARGLDGEEKFGADQIEAKLNEISSLINKAALWLHNEEPGLKRFREKEDKIEVDKSRYVKSLNKQEADSSVVEIKKTSTATVKNVSTSFATAHATLFKPPAKTNSKAVSHSSSSSSVPLSHSTPVSVYIHGAYQALININMLRLPSFNILDKEIRHYAMLYNMLRLFHGLRTYQQRGGRTPRMNTKLLMTDLDSLRNMLRHQGAAELTPEQVFATANQLCEHAPEIFRHMAKPHTTRHALSDTQLQSLDENFGSEEKLWSETISTSDLSITKPMVAMHEQKQETDIPQAQIDMLIEEIYQPVTQRILDALNFDDEQKDDVINNKYYFHAQALKMILSMSGEYKRHNHNPQHKAFLKLALEIGRDVGHVFPENIQLRELVLRCKEVFPKKDAISQVQKRISLPKG